MQFLVYIIVYPILWLVSILPFKLLYAVSDVVYFFLYRIFGYRTKVVRENLELVFPEKSAAEIKEIMRKFYHHLCDMMVEAIKSLSISEAEMKQRFTFSNLDLMREVEKQHRGVALLCAHYGSWEWVFVLQTYFDNKGIAIYKRLGNKYFDRLVKRIRAKYNSYLITTKEIIPELTKMMKQGIHPVTGFATDQSPKPSKAFHWTEFMNIKVPVHTGAEMLAKRFDMPVVFFRVKRLKRGFYETTFDLITMNPKDFDNYQITDAYLKLVEQQIYEAPEFYLWTHKRWKHRDKVPAKFQ